jgi:hypothetical protein
MLMAPLVSTVKSAPRIGVASTVATPAAFEQFIALAADEFAATCNNGEAPEAVLATETPAPTNAALYAWPPAKRGAGTGSAGVEAAGVSVNRMPAPKNL